MAKAPEMSLPEFERHLARAGITVTPEKARELHAYAPFVLAMAARVRQDFTYADEPAHVFKAGKDRR